MDIGIEQDQGQVLGIDDRGVPLHVHDVLGEGRPEAEEGVPPGGVHHGPLGFADDLGVEDLALVEVDVPLLPHLVQELLIVLRIEENDAFPFGNGLSHIISFLGLDNVYNTMNLKAFFILTFFLTFEFLMPYFN